MFIVTLEPGWLLLEDQDGVWPTVHAGIVAFQGFDKSLEDTDGLRAADRREAWKKVRCSDKICRLGGGIGGTIILQPLHGKRGAECLEPALDLVEHDVADHVTGNVPTMGCDLVDYFAFMSVDCGGDAHHLAVSA